MRGCCFYNGGRGVVHRVMLRLIALSRTLASDERQELNSDMLAAPSPCLVEALILSVDVLLLVLVSQKPH